MIINTLDKLVITQKSNRQNGRVIQTTIKNFPEQSGKLINQNFSSQIEWLGVVR